MTMARRQKGNRHRTALFVAAGLGFVGFKLLQRWRQANLSGQVVLITGGSRGLGLALARAFAHERCRLVLCARDEQELDWAREELSQQGAAVLPIVCDVTDQEQVNHAVEEATRHFGQVDILVNNAGQIQVGPMPMTTVKDFEDALAVMFWGALYPTLAVLPQMRARRSGRIVNITSIGGKVGIPHLLPYTCAKFATVGLSEGLRAELGREGISVTTIVPGLMRTGSHLNAMFRGQPDREYAWFSLGASLPFVSMDAARAARQIVQATQRGEAERILSLPANLLERFHGLFPGTTSNVLHVVNRLLPHANGTDTTDSKRGEEIRQRQRSGFLNALTSQGDRAAKRFHQYRRPTHRDS
jgi:NAD(P)-dependent dehydrogenase (short-subunit alcohol dehydrogenase family)